MTSTTTAAAAAAAATIQLQAQLQLQATLVHTWQELDLYCHPTVCAIKHERSTLQMET
jgi:hypothetical protein